MDWASDMGFPSWRGSSTAIVGYIVGLRELVEALFSYAKTEGPVQVEALFDEYNLNIHVTYEGAPMEFPYSPPTHDELMTDHSSLARMSGFMIRLIAEKVTATANGNRCTVSIHITC